MICEITTPFQRELLAPFTNPITRHRVPQMTVASDALWDKHPVGLQFWFTSTLAEVLVECDPDPEVDFITFYKRIVENFEAQNDL